MACKTMFIKREPRDGQAFGLLEVMVATGIAGLIVTALATLAYFTSRSFVAATNYTDMALHSRMALDNMSRTIRQARQVTAYATNSITLLDVNSNLVQYTMNPAKGTLLNISGGVTNTYVT